MHYKKDRVALKPPLGHITIAADGIGHNTNLTYAEKLYKLI